MNLIFKMTGHLNLINKYILSEQGMFCSLRMIVFVYYMMLSIWRPYSIDDEMINEYRTVGGVRTNRGDQSTWTKAAPEPLCPLQIPHYLTWDQT